MIEIAWSGPALADLRSIDAWLTREASKEQAVRTLAAIRLRVQFLQNFPHGGRPFLRHDFRVLRVVPTPYLIIYRLTGSGIEILRLRHEREDWQVET